jgi:hypothetical protein
MALKSDSLSRSRRGHATPAARPRDMSGAAEISAFARNSDDCHIYAKPYGLLDGGLCMGSGRNREADAAHAGGSE